MDAYTDLTVGTRHNSIVTVVSQRRLSCDGQHLQRLLVTDHTGTRFPLLVTPNKAPLVDLKTGALHRITGVVAAAPRETTDRLERSCPDCEQPLRPGQVLDTYPAVLADAASELGIEQRFGIVDADTSIWPVRAEHTQRDDWLPRHDDASIEPPAYVCPACGRDVDTHRIDGILNHIEMDEQMAVGGETVGMAPGGVTDVTTFRENVTNGYTPQPEAISETGVFAEHAFDIGEPADTEALFAPRYATTVSDHPLTGAEEQYLAVGLDSTLSLDAFTRPRVDLVVAIDISGSMSSPFDQYYYDGHGRRVESGADADADIDATDNATSKLTAAAESLCALTEHLRDDDQLGIVLFDHRAHVAKPLRSVGRTDMDAIRRHIRELTPGGGTNMVDGFEAAFDMMLGEPGGPATEQRIVFMTDMMPNEGATATTDLQDRFTDAAAAGVHTTFLGVGVDSNASLTAALSAVRGANHYTIRSAAAFRQRLGEEFEYMVTPLAYDLTLAVDGGTDVIQSVHGSPSADDATGSLLEVATLFASPTRDGAARGGVVLARLDETALSEPLGLTLSWTDHRGRTHSERVTIETPFTPAAETDPDLRKAVALTRYAEELRAWATAVTERAETAAGVDDPRRGESPESHERVSTPLMVPDAFSARFETLSEYLRREEEEEAALGRDTFRAERALLDTLRTADAVSPPGAAESRS